VRHALRRDEDAAVDGDARAVTGRLDRVFFSSRRRHTRSDRDWSSDVCSSDLSWMSLIAEARKLIQEVEALGGMTKAVEAGMPKRSEERRVGKESRSRWLRCR